MRIALVGWGLEIQSVYRFYGPEHDYLIVNESRQDNFPPESDRLKVRYNDTQAPAGIAGQIQDLSYLEGIEAYDKIVYQPTAFFNLQKVFGDNPEFWAKTTTAYDIFYEHQPTKNIIGVTGTKGKGTTSTLIAKMLEAAGKKVHIGGNIGTPILDMITDIGPGDWLVWELANFQLKTARYSPHIAVCLMVVPEHLDWHPTVEDYYEAKANIFKHQTKDDIAIYYPANEVSEHLAGYSPGTKIPYSIAPGGRVREDGMLVVGVEETEIINKRDVKLLGEHNLQNVCAALTAFWQVSQDSGAARQVLSTFYGLEHRLEFVRELDGVSFYNDSFGTTPETLVVAIRSFPQPVVLIAGGHDKGGDYESMAKEIVKDRVKHVIVIGQIAERITRALHSLGYDAVSQGAGSMSEIVNQAKAVAGPGDVVLLSCGTSSFGMFKDYKDRGDQFKNVVNAL